MKKKISIIATATALALTSVLCVYAATNTSSTPCSCGAATYGICGGIKIGTTHKACDQGYADCTVTAAQYQTFIACTECGKKWLGAVHTHDNHELCPAGYIGCPFDVAIASIDGIAG